MKTSELSREYEDSYITELSKSIEETGKVDPELYTKYEVKRGLRDVSGKGVLVGLTKIGEVHSYIIDENESVQVPGRLIYRGYDINDITKELLSQDRFGFEETAFLLLFGKLPTQEELDIFSKKVGDYMALPKGFLNDIILKVPSRDLMNMLQRCALALYSYDKKAEDLSIVNVLRQSIQLIAFLPVFTVYGYQAFKHAFDSQSLVIHQPEPDMSIAENILHMLRPDSKFSRLEAKLLDLALVLHAEHGGGNNSTFTAHVVTSSGTDTYSTIAAALASLKGPKHGGANIKVVEMFDDLKKYVTDWTDEDQLKEYISKLLSKEAYDKQGLIYGMGHAVYSISDPRAIILKEQAKKLAAEKNGLDEFALYERVERLAKQLIAEKRKIYKGVCTNVDFYSGFVYSMLDIPREIYTPLFAVSRIVGWSAHRIEEILNAGKIIRPAYKSVVERKAYVPVDGR